MIKAVECENWRVRLRIHRAYRDCAIEEGVTTVEIRRANLRLRRCGPRWTSSRRCWNGALGWLSLAVLALGTDTSRADEPGGALRNPGFESSGPQGGWVVVTFGAPVRVDADREVVHEGDQSLRVSASEPSDTALAQEVAVRPRGWYRFSGWVRTRALDPMGAPVCGTYEIQRAGGQSRLAAGASHRGDTDWTQIVLVFQAPVEGRVRIAPFFVGYGKGRGTVWFDGLRLEEFEPPAVPARITREPLQAARIEPGQYGQFIEYLCDLVPGMWADKLDDGSFEGLSAYNRMHYLKETDFRQRPWYPAGATNRATFERDSLTKVGGALSYRIAAREDVPCTVGVAQDGIAIRQGVACHYSCYLKREGGKGAVQVRLHREGTVYAECGLEPTAEWTKYHARLVPSGTTSGATLTIEFHGPGTLWLDSASLMPEDAIGGWRRDVVDAVRNLKPGVIRFGGSAVDVVDAGDFEWRDSIGDPDRRKPLRAWGGLQPLAAGLEEIVQFCRLVGAEPLVCVRVVGRTPQDAADEVQYFNGAVGTPMGALRAKNGHAEPYGVRYWQVGNEQRGPDYEKRLPDFCRAMKQVDPSIQVLSSYPTPGVIEGAREWLDFVAPHHYDCADLAGSADDLKSIRAQLGRLAPQRRIRVAVTEWNTTAGDAGPRRARLWSLENALACARYHALLHRHCDLVAIANRSNLVNSFCSGCIQTDNDRLYKTPTYYAQMLYANMAGDRPLRIDSDLPPEAAPDLSATLSPDGTAVVLMAANESRAAITRPLDFSAFGQGGPIVDVWTLADTRHAGEPDVTNSFAAPERVRPVRSSFVARAARFEYVFPPLSLSVLRWRPMVPAN
jgi:alpha-N-arabinofuranosidase